MQTRARVFKYIGWFVALLVLLLVLARIGLAPLTSKLIVDAFARQGVESRIDDVSFDIGDGRFVLTGLTAESDGKQVLAFDRVEITWSWADLADRRLILNAVSIEGLDFDAEQSANGGLVIAGIDLSSAPADQQAAADAPAQQQPLDWSLVLRRLEMKNTGACFRRLPDIDYCNRLASLDWNGNLAFDLAEIDNPALPLKVSGNFGLAGLEIRSNILERKLLVLESLDFNDIEIDSSDHIGIGEIALRTLDLFERAGTPEGQYIEHIDSISATDNRLEELTTLTVADVTVRGNATNVVKSAQNGYELDQWIESLKSGQTEGGSDATAANPTESADSSAASQAFAFALGKLTFETEKTLQYRDLSLDKPFVVGVSTTRLVVESLDSRQPEQASKVDYQTKLDGDSLFKIEGTARPLAARISFDLAGEIRALDLRRLSPFTAAEIGYTIKSGQLDADIKLEAQKSVVNGKVDLIMYQLDLEALSEEDAKAMEASLGFPLNTSLSLLKNREGNIELEVPLSGDLENPDFGTGKIITAEISKAITSAVLTFYSPYGLIVAGDALLNLATALHFEPVVFAAGETAIGQADNAELDRIVSLMQERPGILLRLCPYTTSADRAALFPDTADTPAAELSLNEEQQAALTKLGEARESKVREYLVAKQVASTRLIPCTGNHEETDGPGRVEINI